MRLPRTTLLALTVDRPAALQPPTTHAEDRRYWLSHCEGFQVDSPEGRVGVVESVVYATSDRRPAYLAVVSGRLLLRTTLVPCGEVVSIQPREARLNLRSRPSRP
jgi:hypothetical protein